MKGDREGAQKAKTNFVSLGTCIEDIGKGWTVLVRRQGEDRPEYRAEVNGDTLRARALDGSQRELPLDCQVVQEDQRNKDNRTIVLTIPRPPIPMKAPMPEWKKNIRLALILLAVFGVAMLCVKLFVKPPPPAPSFEEIDRMYRP